MPPGETHDRPGVGIATIVTRGDKVLLLKRRNSHGAGTWCVPGGHLDHGETPEECAVRETREETAVEVRGLEFRGVTNDIFESEGKHYVTLWFEAEYVSGEPTVSAPEEMSEVGWFGWDQLPDPLFLSFENLLSGNRYPAAPAGDS